MTVSYGEYNTRTGDPRPVDQVLPGDMVSFNELYESKTVYKVQIENPWIISGNPAVLLYFTDGTVVTFDDYIVNAYTVLVVLENI